MARTQAQAMGTSVFNNIICSNVMILTVMTTVRIAMDAECLRKSQLFYKLDHLKRPACAIQTLEE